MILPLAASHFDPLYNKDKFDSFVTLQGIGTLVTGQKLPAGQSSSLLTFPGQE
jgi:hypothetical protein